jgi:hypothetical protein
MEHQYFYLDFYTFLSQKYVQEWGNNIFGVSQLSSRIPENTLSAACVMVFPRINEKHAPCRSVRKLVKSFRSANCVTAIPRIVAAVFLYCIVLHKNLFGSYVLCIKCNHLMDKSLIN